MPDKFIHGHETRLAASPILVVAWFHVWDSKQSTSTVLFAIWVGLCLTRVGEQGNQRQMEERKQRTEVATDIWPESDTGTPP